MITTDLHARLSVALGPTIPVLLPEQLRDPLEAAPLDAQGRPSVTGGERGLGAYLKAHPGGYVQLYDPGFGFTVNGWADNQTLQIDCMARTDTQALDLAQRVRTLLGSTPRRGGTRPLSSPPTITHRDALSARVTLQFNVRSAHP